LKQNAMTFVLTGLDIAAKAETAEQMLWTLLGGKERFAETPCSSCALPGGSAVLKCPLLPA
jgi:hypothetical protein